MAEDVLTDLRTGSNIQHSLTELLRQSIYSPLAGYDDTNDTERLDVDPVIRQVAGEGCGVLCRSEIRRPDDGRNIAQGN